MHANEYIRKSEVKMYTFKMSLVSLIHNIIIKTYEDAF